MKRSTITLSALSCAVLTSGLGCTPASHSKQFVDAQRVYDHARVTHGETYAPAELAEAQKFLRRAEEAKDGSEEEVQWSYMADRQARLAEARGSTKRSRELTESANEQYVQAEVNARKEAERELDQTKGKLKESNLSREEAEARAAAAMASLEKIATVKEDSRETKITLSGSVLFKTGEATLLPVAELNLKQVAEALKSIAGDSMVLIEGYTDSQGGDDANMALSQKRAESVRTYLSNQGLKPDQLKAEGRGETNPVADNATAEGRANNRRVELIVKKAPEDLHAEL